MILKLLVGCLLMGLFAVIIGLIISFILKLLFSVDLPLIFKPWKNMLFIPITLFFTGVSLHLFKHF